MYTNTMIGYDTYSYLKAKETRQVKAETPSQQTQYTEKLSVTSFRDVLRKSFNNENSIPTADFSEYNEFKTTGDEKKNENIKNALNYCSSCFDFTNSKDYDRLTAEENFSGLSNAEKYKSIYEKYQHCYGENFLEASAGDYGLIPSEYDIYTPVIRKFKEEVNEACGGEAEVIKARRDALYGENLSDTEVRKAIIEKYVTDGKITNRDYNKMTNEMDLCGVGGGIRNSNTKSDKVPVNIFDYLRERGMDAAADEIMKSCMTDKEIAAYYSHSSVVRRNSNDLDSYMTADDFNVLMKGYEHRVYMKNVSQQYGEALAQILSALN
ncbi:MAG: hypothetical protein K2K57_03635 [Oscillospiraceae bacterium]|nr:hypothetical protein [Oscillospiraceae bacterium]